MSELAKEHCQEGVSDQATPNTSKPRRFDRTRKAVRFVAAVDAWKRQFSILRHRLSFPLLRRVIQTERQRLREQVTLKNISIQDLERSKLGHGFLIVVMGACLLWAALNVIKGTAALVRFDVYMNTWLITGVPLAIFAGVRLRMSLLSYKLFSEELSRRERGRGRK
ncbi:hypothetical protein SSTU70S_05726 [Stutzerimonas stutzeri]